MKQLIDRFYGSLSHPVTLGSRVALVLLVIPLALSFTQPLWKMHLVAPQYPNGLDLEIYAHTVDGDLNEINTLNHYIGMAPIDRTSLSDLDWIPFALGALILLALRVAVVGDVRSLIDLLVLFSYFGLFSLGRFYYRLYVFGHNLDARAPFTVEPFTPPILGTEQIANFTTTSVPAPATFLIALFALGLTALVAWNLIASARPPARA
jgi:copper chaperone NosL